MDSEREDRSYFLKMSNLSNFSRRVNVGASGLRCRLEKDAMDAQGSRNHTSIGNPPHEYSAVWFLSSQIAHALIKFIVHEPLTKKMRIYYAAMFRTTESVMLLVMRATIHLFGPKIFVRSWCSPLWNKQHIVRKIVCVPLPFLDVVLPSAGSGAAEEALPPELWEAVGGALVLSTRGSLWIWWFCRE